METTPTPTGRMSARGGDAEGEHPHWKIVSEEVPCREREHPPPENVSKKLPCRSKPSLQMRVSKVVLCRGKPPPQSEGCQQGGGAAEANHPTGNVSARGRAPGTQLVVELYRPGRLREWREGRDP